MELCELILQALDGPGQTTPRGVGGQRGPPQFDYMGGGLGRQQVVQPSLSGLVQEWVGVVIVVGFWFVVVQA